MKGGREKGPYFLSVRKLSRGSDSGGKKNPRGCFENLSSKIENSGKSKMGNPDGRRILIKDHLSS